VHYITIINLEAYASVKLLFLFYVAEVKLYNTCKTKVNICKPSKNDGGVFGGFLDIVLLSQSQNGNGKNRYWLSSNTTKTMTQLDFFTRVGI
jgi:hypothetical protein